MPENKTINTRPEIQIFGVGMNGKAEEITSAGEIPMAIRKLVENIEATFRANEEAEEPSETEHINGEMRKIEEVTDKMAIVDSCYYKALIRRGFTEEQAFEIMLTRISAGDR